MLRPLLLILLPLLLAFGAPAAAQEGAAQEAQLSEAEKKAIQEALVWTGDYEARVDGAFGPATRNAIREFQSDEGFTPTGYLSQSGLDRLLELRRTWTERFGWEIRRFPDLGLQIGVPSALFREPESRENGLRFRSKEDQPRSELRLYSAPPMSEARFEALREELIDREHFHRGIYDAGNEDWFVFSGTSDAGVEQYTHVVNRNHGVRGFSFRYLDRHEDELSRLNVAMYNSLQTFPAEGQATAPETAEREQPRPAPSPEGGALFSEEELGLLGDAPAPEPRRERLSGGFLVNPRGAILTTATAIDGCERVQVNRRVDATITAIDRRHDLALLKVPAEGQEYPHMIFRGEPLEEDMRLRALGQTIEDGKRRLTVEPGEVKALSGPEGDIRHFRVDAQLRATSRGAPLVDTAGRVAGMAVGLPAAENADGGALEPEQRLAVRSSILEAFLGAHGVSYELAPGEAEAEEEIDPAVRLATLTVECVR